MLFIVPKITETFTKANVKLPALTQFIVNTSNFFKKDYLIIILIFVLVNISIKLIKKTNIGKMMFAKLAISIPVL
jgi:type II secretory pathway component PulF